MGDERPLYVELVRESFTPRLWVKKAHALTFLLSYVFLSALHAFEPGAFYPLLLIFVLLLAYTFEKTHGLRKSLIELPDLRVKEIAPQIPVGLGIGAALGAAILIGSGRPVEVRSMDFFAVLGLLWGMWIVVAPIESLLQAWVWPQVLPYGLIVGQVFFAVIHPQVLVDGNLYFGVYAFLAGVLFATLTALRYFGPRRSRKAFGLVTTIACHGAMNVVFGLLVVSVSGFELVPLVVP